VQELRLRSRLITQNSARTSKRPRKKAAWAALGLIACLSACSDDDGEENPSSAADAATATDASTSKDAATSSDGGTASESQESAATSDGKLTGEIKTAAGTLRGDVVDHEGKQILFFRNVRYAEDTSGENRWKPPVSVKSWTGVKEATEYGNRCPQGESTLSSPGAMSEDCLNLNLLTPAIRANEKLPVMVFFHGGGLSVGTGNSSTYAHTALPAEGVVVVTVNSRLGPFGYFSHPGLAKESEHESSGNYGTLDLIESLKWVQKNIAAFGGDKDNVTIFGESGGGSKVLSCMSSPLAKGLFHRAIIESGSRSSTPGATTTRENAEAAGLRVAEHLEIADDDDAVKKLRELSWEDVLEASAVMELMYAANLSIDGWVLTEAVNEVFEQGKQIDVPLIVGANEGEVGEFTSSIPSLAANMANVKSKAYVYNFSHLPEGWREPGCYAFHGLELPYVFGHLEGITAPTIIYLGERSNCTPSNDPKVGEDDQTVANHAMALWTQFAKTGNPSVDGLIDWPAYTADDDRYLDIGVELKVKSGVANAGIMPGTGAEAP
jgi:para-nitrobenzyl esterase